MPLEYDSCDSSFDEEDLVLWEAIGPAKTRRVPRAAKFVLGSVALFATAVGIAMFRQQPSSARADAKVGASVGLNAVSAMVALADGLKTAVSLTKDAVSLTNDASKSKSDLANTFYTFLKTGQADMSSIRAMNKTESLAAWNHTKYIMSLRGDRLLAKNGMHDGNICPNDEEELAGLCYETCSALTDGAYPIRTSAFTCCEERPCTVFNSKVSSVLRICSGLDVATKRKGGLCPHAPGDCLRNEEFFLGMCYKTCSTLTQGKNTFRISPSSCCKYNNKLACLDAMSVDSNTAYNVGGGLGDAKLEADYGAAHLPAAALVEVPIAQSYV
jgi:hypothetical protein